MADFARQNQGKPVGTDLADITVVAGRIDNVESALVGNLSLAGIEITGGTIDGATVGITSPSTGSFTSLHASTLVISGGVFNVAGEFSTTGSITAGSAITTGGAIAVASEGSVGASFTIASQLTVNGQDRVHVISDADQNNHGNGTPYALEWNQEVYDIGSLHSSGVEPSRLTAVNAGTYFVEGQLNFSGGAMSWNKAFLYVDGAEVSRVEKSGGAGLVGMMQVTDILVLGAASYVELFMDSVSTAGNILAANSFFKMVRLH